MPKLAFPVCHTKLTLFCISDIGWVSLQLSSASAAASQYALPFGAGKRFGTSAGGAGKFLISDWTVNTIVTVQSAFPFTPQFSYTLRTPGAATL
jgi:hypothetical protein